MKSFTVSRYSIQYNGCERLRNMVPVRTTNPRLGEKHRFDR